MYTFVATDTEFGLSFKRTLTTSALFDCAARWIGFWPKSSVASKLAPSSNKRLHTASCPADAARWSGVCFFCKVRMNYEQIDFTDFIWRLYVLVSLHIFEYWWAKFTSCKFQTACESPWVAIWNFIIMYAFIFTYIVRNEPLLHQFQSYAQHTNNISWNFYLTKISNTILASIVRFWIDSVISEIVLYYTISFYLK